MPKALVTGANGHLGAHVVRALIDQGWDVVPFVRKTSDLRALQGLGLEYRYGEVLDAPSLDAAARGCDYAFHLAAVYALGSKSEAEVVEPAVRGTANLLSAAKKNGLKRVVLTSSTFSIGFAHEPKLLTEKDWNQELFTPYAKAKIQSEREAHRQSAAEGVDLVVVNPTGLLGAWDYKITPSTSVLMQMLNGRGLTGRGGAGMADIRAVARAHVAAAEKGRSGERYILAGENLDNRLFGQLADEISGQRTRYIPGPRFLALASVAAAQAWSRIRGQEPAITYQGAKSWANRWAWYDSSKAVAELGYEVVPAREVYLETASWLAFNGNLIPKVAEKVLAARPARPEWVK